VEKTIFGCVFDEWFFVAAESTCSGALLFTTTKNPIKKSNPAANLLGLKFAQGLFCSLVPITAQWRTNTEFY
jgi:hypothetical protein